MKVVLSLIAGIAIGVGGVFFWPKRQMPEKPREYPLLRYTVENLGRRSYQSQIFLDDQVSPGEYNFHFDSDGKVVTGLTHVPDGCGQCPVIVQFRGYYEREKYYSGAGTKRTAQKFSEAGFISLAPDFLGYGGSASPSANVWEERFEKYTVALNLLAAVDKWEMSNGKIGIWGHSNGGQIALTVLEITGKNYPTVLWAPVSAPFPYSVLYYTDESEDNGKLLRKELAEFEKDYDAEQFSPFNYLNRITAPILLQQGSVDESVPVRWSRSLVKRLRVEYVEYPGADHNLMPNWGEAVRRDIEFFNEKLR